VLLRKVRNSLFSVLEFENFAIHFCGERAPVPLTKLTIVLIAWLEEE
jgi:hypothetical protein